MVCLVWQLVINHLTHGLERQGQVKVRRGITRNAMLLGYIQVTIDHGHAIAHLEVIQNRYHLVGLVVLVLVDHGIHLVAARADINIAIGAQRHLPGAGHFGINLDLEPGRHM